MAPSAGALGPGVPRTPIGRLARIVLLCAPRSSYRRLPGRTDARRKTHRCHVKGSTRSSLPSRGRGAGRPDLNGASAPRRGPRGRRESVSSPRRAPPQGPSRPLLPDAWFAPGREDALQDTLLRAWRGLPRFGGRRLFRPWLYRIATNVCLDALARRPKRLLPIDHGPPAGPDDDPGEPLAESVWL